MSDSDDSEGPFYLVIDGGTDMSKAGFGGDDAPRAVFPSVVKRPKRPSGMVGPDLRDCYVGDEAQSKRRVPMDVLRPIDPETGVVSDWAVMEKLWHHTFYNELRVAPEEHGLVISEPPLNPKGNREKTVQIMFEKFGIQRLFLASGAVLSLVSEGRSTGVVVSSGASITWATPVYQGYAIPSATRLLRVGGQDLTTHLVKLLSESGYTFTTAAERETVRDIKEKLCYVALDSDTEMAAAAAWETGSAEDRAESQEPLAATLDVSQPPACFGGLQLCVRTIAGAVAWQGSVDRSDKVGAVLSKIGMSRPGHIATLIIAGSLSDASHTFEAYATGAGPIEATLVTRIVMKDVERCYEIPDGSVINVGTQRFRCPEALFKPALVDKEGDGLPDLAFSCIMACDVDIRRYLFSNVHLVGGSTLFAGIKDRMMRDLQILAPRATQCRVVARPERKYAEWTGGSVFSSLSSFYKLCITRDEYDTRGPSIVHIKCF